MFFDMEQSGLMKEWAAEYIGKEIRFDIECVENAIKDFDLKKALSLLDEMKKVY